MDNRLSKTISNQDKYDLGMLTSTPSTTTKQYINSIKDNISSSTGFRFDQICGSLKGKEDYLCGISTNTGNQLMYKDRNIGYCLLPNETSPSNVMIWKSFWNEIGDNVDTTNGKYPVICWGQSTLMLENTITELEKTHVKSANLKTYQRYSSLQCCDITPLFKNSQPLIIQPGETKTVSINFDASLNLWYKPNHSIDEDYEDYENFAAENATYYVEFSRLRLYDEHKNIVKQVTILDSGSSVTSWSAGYSIMIENNTSDIQKVCYFDVVANVYVESNSFSYQIVDLMTGNVVDTIDTTNIDLQMDFAVENFESFDYTNQDSSMQPIGESDNAIYIIPHKCYEVDLNGEWLQTYRASITDSATLYDGPYKSWSNTGVNNSGSKMFIDIHGYDTFKILVRSDSEGGYSSSSSKTLYDGIIVSQLDKDIEWNTNINDASLIKYSQLAENTNDDISGYTEVSFTNIGGGDHRITIIYKKDSSDHENEDCGYVVIPGGQEKYSTVNVKGSYYTKLWGETSSKYWPNATSASLSNTYDTIIRTTNTNTSLYAYKYNTSTGKYYTYTSSSWYAHRFGGNYYDIKNKLVQEGFSNPTGTWMYSTNPNDTSNNIVHITMSNSYKKTSPIHGISASVIVPTLGSSYIQNGDIWIFYPGTTSRTSASKLPSGISAYLTPFQDADGVAVYIIPAYSAATSSAGFTINAYVGFWDTSTDTSTTGVWYPNTTASGTNINLATNLSSCALNLYYNNIVVVSKSLSYNAIDVYRYQRTNGEFVSQTRKLNFN